VPGRLSVVGFDDIESAALLKLSTVHQPLEQSGAEGARRLCALLRGARVRPLRQLLPLRIVQRASSAVLGSAVPGPLVPGPLVPGTAGAGAGRSPLPVAGAGRRQNERGRSGSRAARMAAGGWPGSRYSCRAMPAEDVA
jgi:Periplasmic binding protein-like domain